MRSFSISFLTAWICELSSRASLVVTEAAMTGRETPQARPRAVLEGTLDVSFLKQSCLPGQRRVSPVRVPEPFKHDGYALHKLQQTGLRLWELLPG